MARHNQHKKKNKNVTHTAPVSEQQWQSLSTDSHLAKEYVELSNALQQAHTQASQMAQRSGGNTQEYIDYSRAFSIVDRTPELVPYLASLAKESSNVPTNYTTRSAPSGVVSPQSQNMSSAWSGQKNMPEGVPNARILRDWADSNEWTRAAINVRRQQIGRANIAVIPFNERKSYNKGLAKRIQLLLDQPNEYRQNYYDLMASLVDDILVLDRGVLLKDMTVDRKPVHLYNEDGACVKIYPDWNGSPNEPRYLYENLATNVRVPLRNDEVIMMMANPATYRYGLSPVQVLRNTIQADLAATRSAIGMVDMKPPPHMIQVPGATQSQLEQIRNRYETDIAGRKEIFWLGGQTAANVQSLVFSAKDNQWLEWQVYLARKIAVVFQISPQQLGITFDINKATASSQQEIFEDTGLIPLLLLVEEYFNREILGDFVPNLPDGRANFDAVNLRILFPEITEADRQIHAERAIAMATSGLAGLPSMTINQVLALFGEEPVPGGNTFYILNQAQGAMPWLSYDGETGDFGTMSTAGVQGAQDAGGGPDTAETTPDAKDDAKGPKPTPPPTEAGSAPSDAAPATPAATTPKKSYNNRSFGKRTSILHRTWQEKYTEEEM